MKDKKGNDHADRIADEGVKLHGNAAMETGVILIRRHEQCVNLISEIHSHCLEAFGEKKKLEEKTESEITMRSKEDQTKKNRSNQCCDT